MRFALTILIITLSFFNSQLKVRAQDTTQTNKAIDIHGRGEGCCVRVDHNDDLNLNNGNYTIEVWCNSATTLGYSPWGSWIISKGSSNSNLEYLLGVDMSGKLSFWNTETQGLHSSAQLQPHTWYHIAVVAQLDSHQIRFYLNGELDTIFHLSEVPNTTTSKPLFLGARYSSSSNGCEFWDGYLDEVRLWNRVRTQTEIKASINTSLKGNEPGLVAYWTFDDTDPESSADKTANKHKAEFVRSVKRVQSTAPIQYK